MIKVTTDDGGVIELPRCRISILMVSPDGRLFANQLDIDPSDFDAAKTLAASALMGINHGVKTARMTPREHE